MKEHNTHFSSYLEHDTEDSQRIMISTRQCMREASIFVAVVHYMQLKTENTPCETARQQAKGSGLLVCRILRQYGQDFEYECDDACICMYFLMAQNDPMAIFEYGFVNMYSYQHCH